jgi:hypothetical protein
MSEELKEYMENSKESRKNLTKLAKSLQTRIESNSPILNKKSYDVDFPTPNPMRFKEFKEKMTEDLQKIFKTQLSTPKKKTTGSLLVKKNTLSSVYNCVKIAHRNVSIFPPIIRSNQITIPQRLLGGKYSTEESEASIVSHTKLTPKKKLNSRFEVKKQLLIPILKKQY